MLRDWIWGEKERERAKTESRKTLRFWLEEHERWGCYDLGWEDYWRVIYL